MFGICSTLTLGFVPLHQRPDVSVGGHARYQWTHEISPVTQRRISRVPSMDVGGFFRPEDGKQ